MRQRLFTPGPTQIPERVVVAMSGPMIHHRGPEFKALFDEVTTRLKYVFQTKGDVLILTASGSGGMEASVVNLLSPGDKALSIEFGKFGERWGELCRAYGLTPVTMKVPWGEAPDPAEVKKLVQSNPNLKAVFFTHSETSTGVASDLKEIAKVIRENSEALTVIDGITSVGVLPLYMDDWNIDVCVTGSQKGVMIPPGLSFVALNQRAWQRVETSTLPRYYFDFLKARKSAAEKSTAFTPAVTLLVGLQESLRMMEKYGLEFFWKKYDRLASATREGMKALGLELFAKTPSNALTSVKVPQGLEGSALTKTLREKYGVTVAGGQSQLKGKIFRVAHMGYYDHMDMVALMAAVEMTLADLGWKFEMGKGVATVQQKYARLLSEEAARNTI
jgi:aspartate aminotransferase-like enzyme